MPLSPSFVASQNTGEPSIIVLTDNSSGSDSNITQRRVYLRQADGTYLVPEDSDEEYIEWDYSDASIEIDILDKDKALFVTVQWLDDNPTVLYDDSELIGFTEYNEDFDYGLTTILASNQLLTNDNSFRTNKFDLRLLIDAGNQAIEVGGDINAAQLCYDQATNIRVNSEYYFNESTGT